ncbi:hypothetical protein C8R44DRAFT_894666 [Mycena epipterygia]|nr:hypothetical protein C8R44DRAFT_894666 [Mycena epipterygia]
MLWLPLARKTRSGAEFSPHSLPAATMPPRVSALQDRDFDFSALVVQAITAFDEDWPPRDPLDDVDEQWPPLPPPDPWDDVDDVSPTVPALTKKRRRSRSPSFEEVASSSKKPLTGAHRRRPAKLEKAKKAAEKVSKKTSAAHARRKAKRAAEAAECGHVPAPSTIHTHVKPAMPLTTNFDASTLPTTLGAYAAKVEDKRSGMAAKSVAPSPASSALGFS